MNKPEFKYFEEYTDVTEETDRAIRITQIVMKLHFNHDIIALLREAAENGCTLTELCDESESLWDHICNDPIPF
jgi:hypothetical protein